MTTGSQDQGLDLGTSSNAPFLVAPSAILTGRTAIVASSGYGKSNLIAVVCEELCDRNLPFVVIDIEGGFHSLKEKAHDGRGDVVWIGSDKTCEVPISPAICLQVASAVVKEGGRVVFDVSQRSDAPDLVGAMLSALFEAEDRLPETDRVPVLVVLDEVQRFVPQDHSVVVKEVAEISTLGRKRGLGLVIATQRPALVEKTVLAQCSNQFLGHLSLKNDLDAVRPFLSGSPQAQALVAGLTQLGKGSFTVSGDLTPTVCNIVVRKRTTTDLGSTPTVKEGKTNFAESLKQRLQGGTAIAASAPTPLAVPPSAPSTSPAGIPPPPPVAAAAPLAGPPSVAKASPPPPSPSKLRGVPFSPQVTVETATQAVQSHRIHPGHLLQFVFEGKMHTTEPQPVFWPLLQFSLGWVPPKHLLGRPQPVTLTALWDPRMSRFVQFDGSDLVAVGPTYAPALLALPWESIRVLRALGGEKDPTTAADLSPKVSGLGLQKIVSALGALASAGLVRTAPEEKGPRKPALYTTDLRLEEIDPRKLGTTPPRAEEIAVPSGTAVLPVDVGEEQTRVRSLLAGLSDNVDVGSAEVVAYPYFRVVLEPPGRGTFTRTVLVSGISGKATVLDGDDALRALR